MSQQDPTTSSHVLDVTTAELQAQLHHHAASMEWPAAGGGVVCTPMPLLPLQLPWPGAAAPPTACCPSAAFAAAAPLAAVVPGPPCAGHSPWGVLLPPPGDLPQPHKAQGQLVQSPSAAAAAAVEPVVAGAAATSGPLVSDGPRSNDCPSPQRSSSNSREHGAPPNTTSRRWCTAGRAAMLHARPPGELGLVPTGAEGGALPAQQQQQQQRQRRASSTGQEPLCPGRFGRQYTQSPSAVAGGSAASSDRVSSPLAGSGGSVPSFPPPAPRRHSTPQADALVRPTHPGGV